MDELAQTLPWLLALVLLIALAVLLLRSRPRFAPKPLLTQNEIEFFHRLQSALPDLAIFPQVALRALIRPGSLSTTRAYGLEASLIGAKHCDFLICRPDSFDVVAIVELDDRSHSREKDLERDRMTAAAGYRINQAGCKRSKQKQQPKIR